MVGYLVALQRRLVRCYRILQARLWEHLGEERRASWMRSPLRNFLRTVRRFLEDKPPYNGGTLSDEQLECFFNPVKPSAEHLALEKHFRNRQPPVAPSPIIGIIRYDEELVVPVLRPTEPPRLWKAPRLTS